MPFDRDTMEDALGPTALSDHMFDHVPSKRDQEETESNRAADSKTPSAQAVERAESAEEAETIVKQALFDKFAAFIGDDVPADQPIMSIGLDSLVLIELKNWIKHIFQTPLQTSELIGAQSIIALAKLIVSRMDLKCKDNTKADNADEKHEGAYKTLNSSSRSNKTFGLLRAPGSPARQIFQELFKTHEHDESNGWYNDVVTDARWLFKRSPIAPYVSIIGAHRDSKRPQSQAERAAIITFSALSFKRAIKDGAINPLRIAGKPECTWRWDWLFNTARVPHIRCDKMIRSELNDQTARDHIAVLRGGHVFKVMLQEQDQGKDVPFEELKATFEAIVAEVEDDSIWPGILTTDERDSWALDPSPSTGLLMAPLLPASLEWIVTAIDEYSPTSSIDQGQLNGSLLSKVELDEVVLQKTPEIESHINVLRNRFLEYTSTAARTYVCEHLNELGTDFLLQGKVPIKGVVDITFQLALRLFFGRSIPSWEPTSAAHFHTGRSNAVQKATPAVVAFCDAAAEAYQNQDQI
ncbi:hypothetical protein MMC13_000272 [Lambiella insularis]|nr:hypothetical protein [Lambiella insularis]